MRREQLEHLIRAAAQVADADDLVVVGSQAILGAYPDAPESLLASIEADMYPRAHPERADLIDGAIGEGSLFQDTFGYYAHGVGPETAKGPRGWEERLIPLRNENTRGATGWCMEPHDLVLAKCVAGRDRDWAFARAAIAHGLVEVATLRARAADLPVQPEARAAIASGLESPD